MTFPKLLNEIKGIVPIPSIGFKRLCMFPLFLLHLYYSPKNISRLDHWPEEDEKHGEESQASPVGPHYIIWSHPTPKHVSKQAAAEINTTPNQDKSMSPTSQPTHRCIRWINTHHLGYFVTTLVNIILDFFSLDTTLILTIGFFCPRTQQRVHKVQHPPKCHFLKFPLLSNLLSLLPEVLSMLWPEVLPWLIIQSPKDLDYLF